MVRKIANCANKSSTSFDSGIEITSYTSNYYICPKEGYISIYLWAANSGVTLNIADANSSNVGYFTCAYNSILSSTQGTYLYVKKGMKIKVFNKVGNADVYFHGIN